MSLLDEAKALVVPRGPQCRVCRLLTAANPTGRAEIEEALADRQLEAEAIARALQARGHTIQGASVARHRRGGCVPR
jgi:hypothetical protein